MLKYFFILTLSLFFQGCTQIKKDNISRELLASEASSFHNELIEITNYSEFNCDYLGCIPIVTKTGEVLQQAPSDGFDQWQFTTPVKSDSEGIQNELQAIVLTIKLTPTYKTKSKNILGTWRRFDIIILELNEFQPESPYKGERIHHKNIPKIKDEGDPGSTKLLLQLLNAKFKKG
jgi:hypothetical protein